jgi:NADH-quinone oxidoreductase subunit J
MIVTSPVFFYLFAALAVACSLLVVMKRNPVSSAFSLVLVFFAFAGIYALLQAHLIAAVQIFVYTGAVTVLFVFVIMLLNADVPSLDIRRTPGAVRAVAGLMCLALLGLFIWIFKNSPVSRGGPWNPDSVAAAGGNSQVIAELMFSDYILPFELTSVLLLAAIVAVVAIAMRKDQRKSHKVQ